MKKNYDIGGLNENSPFINLYDWVRDKFHANDSKKIDAILESCKDFIELKNDESRENKIAERSTLNLLTNVSRDTL